MRALELRARVDQGSRVGALYLTDADSSESQVTWEVRWGSVGVSHVPRVTMSGELDSNYQRSETPWLRDVSASKWVISLSQLQCEFVVCK